jgi:hypothetical protein
VPGSGIVVLVDTVWLPHDLSPELGLLLRRRIRTGTSVRFTAGRGRRRPVLRSELEASRLSLLAWARLCRYGRPRQPQRVTSAPPKPARPGAAAVWESGETDAPLWLLVDPVLPGWRELRRGAPTGNEAAVDLPGSERETRRHVVVGSEEDLYPKSPP